MKPCLKTLNLVIIFWVVCASRVQADDVYISNTDAGTITQINSSGSVSIFASGLDSPEGLAFDNAGNLYEADNSSYNIYEFTPSGVQTSVDNSPDPEFLAFQPVPVPEPTVSGLLAAASVALLTRGRRGLLCRV